MDGESVSTVGHMIRVLRAYAQDGAEGVNEVATRLHERAHQQPGHAFSKRHTRYLPVSPFPPSMWRYECGRCRFWREGGPGEPGGCDIVGCEDDPFGGERIHPYGWCGLWTPPEGEPAFSWLYEQLSPGGKSSVRGEYDPPLTQKERLRRERQKRNRKRRERGSESSQQATRIPVGDGDEE